jgi:hypothetical protein
VLSSLRVGAEPEATTIAASGSRSLRRRRWSAAACAAPSTGSAGTGSPLQPVAMKSVNPLMSLILG